MTLFLILLFAVTLIKLEVSCLQASDIVHISEESYPKSKLNPPFYSDNPQTILFSSLDLSEINPQFTLSSLMYFKITTSSLQNIFQIYNINNPDIKPVILVVNALDLNNISLELYSQPSQNIKEGLISKVIEADISSQFMLSFSKNGNQITFSFRFHFKQIDFIQQITFNSSITNWTPTDYVFQLSNSVPIGSSLQELPLSGSLHHIYLIKNLSILITTDDHTIRFIESLSPYADQQVLYNYFFDPEAGQTPCIADTSNKKLGCITESDKPKLQYWRADFHKEQFVVLNHDYTYLYSPNVKFETNIHFTLSFWFYISDITSGTYNVITIKDNDLNQLLLLRITKSGPSSYIFKPTFNNLQGADFTKLLDNQKYYFIIGTYYQVQSQYFFDIVIVDDTTIYQQKYTTAFINFQQFYFMRIGGPVTNYGGFYRITQYQQFTGRQFITDSSLSDSIIPNCIIVTYYRDSFKCLICAKNYFLDFTSNQCLSYTQCNVGVYDANYNVRSCYRKCPFKCETCDSNFNCLTCSSPARDPNDKCNCFSGYEDQTNTECPIYRRFPANSIIYKDLSIKQNTLISGALSSFNFKSIPNLIFLLSNFWNNQNLIKSSLLTSITITKTNFQATLTPSYDALNTVSAYSTQVNYQILAYSSSSEQMFSKMVTLYFDVEGTTNVNIEIGKYNVAKYGPYQIVAFLSGFQMSTPSVNTNLYSKFKIDINSTKTKLMVTVSNSVKVLQITYVVIPLSQPSLFLAQSFSSLIGYYNDPTLSFTEKSTIPVQQLTSPQNNYESYSFNLLCGLNSLESQSVAYGYNLLSYPRQDFYTQKSHFHVYSQRLYQYSLNGFYLVDIYNLMSDELCKTRNFYTNKCITCKDSLAIPSFDCTICKSNRVIIGTTCECPDSDFTNEFDDEFRCSYQDTAVLNINLSVEFNQLTIDFGLPIKVISYTLQASPTYDLCSFLFETQTLDLIKESAKCSLTGNIILINLQSDSLILKDDVVVFKNTVLKFTKYPQTITNFLRNKVYQQQLLFSPYVDIQYDSYVSTCDPFEVKIITFFNHQGRGIKSFTWELVELNPASEIVAQNVNSILDKANAERSRNLFFPIGTLLIDMTMTLRLNYEYKIDISSEKIMKITLKQTPILRATSRLLNSTPYFSKNEFMYQYTIFYTQCNQLGQKQEISSVKFDIQIEEPTMNLIQNINDYEKKSFPLILKPFQAKPNTIHSIKTTPSDSFVFINQLPITQAPIIVQIDGGSRLHDYNQELAITGTLIDQDMSDQTQPSGITFSWHCQDLMSYGNCLDMDSNIIVIPQNSQTITFPPNQFIPYSVVQISLKGIKGPDNRTSYITVQFTDSMIPLIQVKLSDPQLLQSTVNMNQIIEAQILYDPSENVNNIFFAGAITYERKIQNVMVFEYGKVRFQIWNYFSDFQTTNNKFQIKFTVYNPKYSIPSQSILNFELNFPPQNCILSIDPPQGFSLSTKFVISMTLCDDLDLPINYKYYFYNSKSLYDFEIENPLLIQRKQITDQIEKSSIETYLPEGEIFVLVQVIDSKNAIKNLTQTITISPQVLDQSAYILLVDNIISFASTQTYSEQTLLLSLLSEDIIKKPQYYAAIQPQINQIIASLKSLTNSDELLSTFPTLATQAISSLVISNAQTADEAFIGDKIDYIDEILTQAQSQLGTNQFKNDLNNQQLYNSFSILDGLSDKNVESYSTDQRIVLNTEKIGTLLNIDALPNESPKIFQGTQLRIVSQLVTQKKIAEYLGQDVGTSWEGEEEDISIQDPTKVNQVYQVSFKQYKKNLYVEDTSFVSFIADIQKQKPDFQINSYKAINPSIQEYGSNEEIPLNNQLIVHKFKPLKNESLTCMSKIKDLWTQNGCSTKYNKQQQSYTCDCYQISPVTVINDIADLIDNENINTIFSDQGIDNILGFDNFYKYVAFWGMSSLTGIYIVLGIYVNFIDKLAPKTNVRVQPIPTTTSPMVQPISRRTSIKSDMVEMTSRIQNKQAYILNTQDKQNFPNQIKIQHSSTLEGKSMRSMNKITFVKDSMFSTSSTKQDVFSKDGLEQNNQVEKPKSPPSLSIINENQCTTEQDNYPTLSIEERQKDKRHSNEAILERNQTPKVIPKADSRELVDKQKAQMFYQQSSLQQIIFFHDFFSIFFISDPNLSRVIRITIFYAKYLHLFTSNIVFNQSYSLVQTLFLQVANSIVVAIIGKFIELGSSSNRFLKKFCQLLTLGLIGFYYYAFLSVVSGNNPDATNKISLLFGVVIAIDILGTCLVLSLIQLFLARNILRQSNIQGFNLKLFVLLKLSIILNNLTI